MCLCGTFTTWCYKSKLFVFFVFYLCGMNWSKFIKTKTRNSPSFSLVRVEACVKGEHGVKFCWRWERLPLQSTSPHHQSLTNPSLGAAWNYALMDLVNLTMWFLWALPTWKMLLQALWQICLTTILSVQKTNLHLAHQMCQRVTPLSISQANTTHVSLGHTCCGSQFLM